MSKMRDADLPLRERIEHAIQRITTGQGLMRVPAEATDPDLVLRDCQQEIDRLTAENDALRLDKATLDDFAHLWYFVSDKKPREFEKIVATYPPSSWLQEAAKLRLLAQAKDAEAR